MATIINSIIQFSLINIYFANLIGQSSGLLLLTSLHYIAVCILHVLSAGDSEYGHIQGIDFSGNSLYY